MKLLLWPPDSIVRRIVVAEILAIAGTLLLLGVFRIFGGVWSHDSLDRSGVLAEAQDLVRTIEAAPPDIRPRLCVAATRQAFRVDWFAGSTAVAAALDQASNEEKADAEVRALFPTGSKLLTFEPSQSALIPNELPFHVRTSVGPYALGVQLSDASWLLFSTEHRTWGLSEIGRAVIWVLFAAISIGVVSAVTARQFARPIMQFAAAVSRFGVDPQSPPLAETGPKELRQVICTFNAMQAQIRRFVSYRTMMLAAISHDLRTPLTRIRLRGEYIDDADQQNKLFRDVDEMQAMIDGALALFRDDAIAEDSTQFDFAQLLATIVHNFADQGATVSYQGQSHADFQGRPFAIKRAMTNLVENSVKYATATEIELRQGARDVEVTVRDRGPGVPEDALRSVFRPYYRLERSRSRSTGGVGLGLTVAQAIIQAHGGEIVLKNRDGGGLEAIVTLPIIASDS